VRIKEKADANQGKSRFANQVDNVMDGIYSHHNLPQHLYSGVIYVVWPLRSVASKYDVCIVCVSSFRIVAFLQDVLSRFFSSFRCVAFGKPINFLFSHFRLALLLSLGICTLL